MTGNALVRTFPLEGVVVLDFTEYVAGPIGGMLLADMGAEVIKVEPYEGDHWRRQQPIGPYESRPFIGVNRGKKSIAVRLFSAEARAVLEDLVRSADVMLVNFRPGVADQLGLGYETVSAIRPDIIYCENTAFGDEGPYSTQPGFDLLMQAMTGIMDYERKVERGVPIGVSTFAPADLSAGMFMAYSVVSALFARTRTGLGQRIQTSLFGSAVAIQYRPLLSIEKLDAEPREMMLAAIAGLREGGAAYDDTFTVRAGLGLYRAMATYYRVYQTKDSLLTVTCLNNRQRRALRDALGVGDPAVDGESFEPSPNRTLDDHEQLLERFESAFRVRTTTEWLEALTAADVPCAPLVLTEEIYTHPQVVAGGHIQRLEHPVVGEILQPRSPIRMSNAEVGAERASPALSEDAREVLGRLGYSARRIAALEADGVVRPPVARRA